MTTYETLIDCEGIELESKIPFHFACCDCGLVHDVVVVSADDSPVGFAVKRNAEATKERRNATGTKAMSKETVLTDEQIESWFGAATEGSLISFARVIEADILASPKIQQALADSRRIDWLADVENTIGNVQLPTECVTENVHSLRDAIDAAMRQETKP